MDRAASGWFQLDYRRASAECCPYVGTGECSGPAPLERSGLVKRHTHIMSQQFAVAVTFLSAFLAVGFSAPQQNAGSPPPPTTGSWPSGSRDVKSSGEG